MANIIALSVSGTNRITGWIEWTEENINNSANTSDIRANVYYNLPSTQGQPTGNLNYSTFYLEINGTRYEMTSGMVLQPGDTKAVFSSDKVQTITHDANGSKSIVISAGGGLPNTSGLVSSSGSATVALTTIPRASTIGTVTGSTIGSAVSVGINRPTGSTFYHKLFWTFGTASGSVNSTSTTATSISWTPSTATLAPLIPNSVSGTATLTLRTYSDSALTTQVGADSVKNITLTLPASVKPTISSLTPEETVTANDTGLYIQSISKVKWTAAVSHSYGATTAQVSMTFEGTTLSGTALNSTFGTIRGSGSLSCSCTITDSRGRSATLTASITATAYSPPKLSSVTIKRNSTTPTTVTVKLTASASSLMNSTQRNTMTVYALYGQSSIPSPSSTYLVTTSGLSASGVTKTYTSVSASSSYRFRIQVSDKFNTTYQDFTLSTADVIMDIRTTGALGIGKYWEYGALDVNGPARFIIPGATGGGEAKTIILPPTYSATAVGTTTNATDYYQKLIKKLCEDFTGSNLLFFGLTQPGSRGILILMIYNTEETDQTTGLPHYCSGLVIPYGNTAYPIKIGTANYVYYELTLGGGGASYTNADDVSF